MVLALPGPPFLWGETHHCTTKMMLSVTLLTNLHAIPISDALSQAISWAISDAVSRGLYEPLVAEAWSNYTHGYCAAAAGGPPSRPTYFNAIDLGPLLGFCLVVSVLSLALTRVGARLHATHHVVEKALEGSVGRLAFRTRLAKTLSKTSSVA